MITMQLISVAYELTKNTKMNIEITHQQAYIIIRALRRYDELQDNLRAQLPEGHPDEKNHARLSEEIHRIKCAIIDAKGHPQSLLKTAEAPKPSMNPPDMSKVPKGSA